MEVNISVFSVTLGRTEVLLKTASGIGLPRGPSRAFSGARCYTPPSGKIRKFSHL